MARKGKGDIKLQRANQRQRLGPRESDVKQGEREADGNGDRVSHRDRGRRATGDGQRRRKAKTRPSSLYSACGVCDEPLAPSQSVSPVSLCVTWSCGTSATCDPSFLVSVSLCHPCCLSANLCLFICPVIVHDTLVFIPHTQEADEQLRYTAREGDVTVFTEIDF